MVNHLNYYFLIVMKNHEHVIFTLMICIEKYCNISGSMDGYLLIQPALSDE